MKKLIFALFCLFSANLAVAQKDYFNFKQRNKHKIEYTILGQYFNTTSGIVNIFSFNNALQSLLNNFDMRYQSKLGSWVDFGFTIVKFSEMNSSDDELNGYNSGINPSSYTSNSTANIASIIYNNIPIQNIDIQNFKQGILLSPDIYLYLPFFDPKDFVNGNTFPHLYVRTSVGLSAIWQQSHITNNNQIVTRHRSVGDNFPIFYSFGIGLNTNFKSKTFLKIELSNNFYNNVGLKRQYFNQNTNEIDWKDDNIKKNQPQIRVALGYNW